MIFLDSSVIIAVSNPLDENFEDGKRLFSTAFSSGEAIVITTHVFDESLTYIRKKLGPQKSETLLSLLMQNKQIEIAFPERQVFTSAAQLFSKHKKFSFCDALSLAVMNSYGIRKILSFDSDFDLPGVERLY